jgi:hypothetical protein
LIEGFARKEFGDKIYEEKYAPKINKEELKNTAVNVEKKKPEQPSLDVKTSLQETNRNYIPYNGGLTHEFVKKNWHYARPCDPNEIIETKGKETNSFIYKNFKDYY